MARYNVEARVYSRKGALLSSASNSYQRTHPKQAYYAKRAGQPDRIYLHAEIAALVKCKGEPYKIVIKRINKDGTLGLAKPCPVCELAIKESGIKIVEYSV